MYTTLSHFRCKDVMAAVNQTRQTSDQTTGTVVLKYTYLCMSMHVLLLSRYKVH